MSLGRSGAGSGEEGRAPRAHFRSVGSAADVVAPREEEAVSPPRLCAGPRPRPRPCVSTALGPWQPPPGLADGSRGSSGCVTALAAAAQRGSAEREGAVTAKLIRG